MAGVAPVLTVPFIGEDECVTGPMKVCPFLWFTLAL